MQQQRSPPRQSFDDTPIPTATRGAADFIATAEYEGARKGYVFQVGPQGLGYYIEQPGGEAAAPPLVQPTVTDDSLLKRGLKLGGAGAMDDEDKMLLAQIRAMEKENAALLQETLSSYESAGALGLDASADGRSPGAARGQTPFGTEHTLANAMDETQQMETALLELQLEKQQLDADYSRMPHGAPKNARDRKKKAQMEERLEQLGKQIGHYRMKLRNPHMH